METRSLSRRCAGLKNVSMWMDSILTWEESDSGSDGNRRLTKAFKPQLKSTVFVEAKNTATWCSEARESFKPYDVTKLDYQSDGDHARIYKKLLELKAKHSGSDKENGGDRNSQELPSEISIEKKIELVQVAERAAADHEHHQAEGVVCVDSRPKPESTNESMANPASRASPDKSPSPTPSVAENACPKQSTSQSALLLPRPALKKKPVVQERSAESQARRQQARQLIKAKWEARRFAQTSQSMSSTRLLSDTAVAFVLGRRPFATFADQTGSRIKDSNRLSFNINPELYPNQPALVQSADSVVERAILKNGPQPIGCRQRIKMLQNKQTRNRLERRQESLARLSQSARGPPSDGWSTRRPDTEKPNAVRRGEGFFVKI